MTDWKALCKGLVCQFDWQGCTCTFASNECCAFAEAEAALASDRDATLAETPSAAPAEGSQPGPPEEAASPNLQGRAQSTIGEDK